MDERAIGVFDSGVGGLTVLHECLVTLPHEDFVYLGDGARLSVHAVFGGVEITIPPTWWVESSATAILGGIDAPSGTRDDPSAPVLTVDGRAIFGGIEIRPSAAGSG